MANTLRDFPPPPAPAPAPVAAQPLPAPAPAQPVATPVAGMVPNTGTNPNPTPANAPQADTNKPWMLERLANWFGLFPFGDSLKNKTVRIYMSIVALVVLIAGLVEVIIQPQTTWNLFTALPVWLQIPATIALVACAAALMMSLDVSWHIVTTRFYFLRNLGMGLSKKVMARMLWEDLKSLFGLAIRITAIVVLTGYNMMSGELAFFRPEIKAEQEREQEENIAVIQRRALDQELPGYDTSIAQIRNATPNAQGVCETDRCRRKQTMLARHATRREVLNREVAAATAAAAGEAGGLTGSGRRGAGSAYNAQLANQRAKERARNEFEAQATRELEAFDHEVDAQIAELTARREAKRNEILTMNPDALARKYRGTYKVELGILNQRRILAKLMLRNPDMRDTRERIQAFLIILQALAIGIKFFRPDAVRNYLNPAAQAKAGNKEAMEELEAIGVKDPRPLALDPDLRELEEEFYTLLVSLVAEKRNLHARIPSKLRKADGSFATHAEIEHGLEHEWITLVNGAVQVDKRQGNETHFRSLLDQVDAITLLIGKMNGGVIPSWPVELNHGIDIRVTGNEPWHVSKEELTRDYGWKDPEPNKEKLEADKEYLDGLRRLVVQKVREMDGQSTREMRDTVWVAMDIIRHLRTDFFMKEINPLYGEIAEVEQRILDNGGKIHNWELGRAHGLNVDVRDYQTTRQWAIAISDLQLGWLQGDRPTPVAKAAPTVPNTNGKLNGHDTNTGDGSTTIDLNDLEEVAGDDITTNKVVTKPPPVPGAAPNAN